MYDLRKRLWQIQWRLDMPTHPLVIVVKLPRVAFAHQEGDVICNNITICYIMSQIVMLCSRQWTADSGATESVNAEELPLADNDDMEEEVVGAQ